MTEQTALVNFTEESAKVALIEARGDLFVASQILGITAIRLHRALQASPVLQATQKTLLETLRDPAFEKASGEQLEAAIQSRLSLYRVVGLDSLAELATMPIDENSAMAQVRLAAAARLAGSNEAQAGSGETADILRALNQSYHENAPRIRIVRERISVEMNGPQQEREVAEIPASSPSPLPAD